MTSPIRLYMSMSLDWFVTGLDDKPGQGLGRDGGRLFNWLDDRNGPGINGQVYAEALATGALISGRRTYDLAGGWGGDHHDGVPINVLTRHPDDQEAPADGTTFYTDVAACSSDARAAAGDRAVMVHGASAAQSLLRAGELDEQESTWSRSSWRRPPPLRGHRPHRARTGPRAPGPRRHPSALPGRPLRTP